MVLSRRHTRLDRVFPDEMIELFQFMVITSQMDTSQMGDPNGFVGELQALVGDFIRATHVLGSTKKLTQDVFRSRFDEGRRVFFTLGTHVGDMAVLVKFLGKLHGGLGGQMKQVTGDLE
jgi:hypothetical protein